MRSLHLQTISLTPLLTKADLERLLRPLPETVEKQETAKVIPDSENETGETVTKTKVSKDPLLTVNAREILDDVVRMLSQRYQVEGTLELELRQPLQTVKLPSEVWELEFTRFPPYGLSPRMILYMRIRSNETVKELQLPVTARIMREVYFSPRRINRGEELEIESFEIQAHDILGDQLDTVPANVDLSEYQLERSIAAQEPLRWSSISLKPTIRKGQIVEVNATSGLMNITMKGEALENGLKGEIIDIRNLTSRKNFQAQIINAQSVRVHF